MIYGSFFVGGEEGVFVLGEGDSGFPLGQGTIPTKPRFRSVPDVADTKFAAPLLAELLIKCQRLPRGFFWKERLAAASLSAILPLQV